MKIIPRNKHLRGVLLGCAALSAVMAGPILVDTSAQALPQAAACTAGGVCLTSNEANAAPVTATETTTVPVTTTELTTLSVPFTTTETNTITTSLTKTTTVTVPATTVTTTQPGTTTTVTVTGFPTFTRTGVFPFTATTADPAVRPDQFRTTRDFTSSATTGSTTTGSAPTGLSCGTPGTTTSLGSGEVETCGPTSGHVAVFATTPGLDNSIDDTTSSYYVSIGLFAPQFRFGFPDGCYYVPDPSSVASPGQTVTSTDGILANAVAFGLHSRDVSEPIQVPRSDCGGSGPVTGAGHHGPGGPGPRR
jgi:hypothetical protein